MIVKMQKVYVVCRQGQKDRLLDALGNLGVVHLAPVHPDQAVAEEQTLESIRQLQRASQLLSTIEPAGVNEDISPVDAAADACRIQRESIELRNRLSTLAHKIDQLEMWGEARLEQFEQIRQSGVDMRFYRVDADQLGDIDAECVQAFGDRRSGKVLVAVVVRSGEANIPPDAEPVELPERDRPSLRAEAAEIDETLQEHSRRLGQLAYHVNGMRAALDELRKTAEYTVAQRSGLDDEALFAVQGFSPVDAAETLGEDLSAAGIDAAVRVSEPHEDEEPPTLIRYPRWVSPIKALFKILGTTPGYREFDLAPFFMIAMPIFTAMLVGDAMYGWLFVIAGALGYRKLSSLGGRSAPNLILVFGIATVIWGMLTGNYFGVSPAQMVSAGGVWAYPGQILEPAALLYRSDPNVSRLLLIKISFILAVVHLVTSHLRQAIGLFPNQKFLSEAGWCSFLTGMCGLVWIMFSPSEPIIPPSGIVALMGAGAFLVVLFSIPSRNVFKRLGLGLLCNIMPMLNTFGDTISYIRLMAVGLASYYIAVAFNGLAMSVAGGGDAILWVPAGIILLLAHAMNITLCLIAIFAHGVRLNMLEFSSNAGVQWTGYPYTPFAVTARNEGDA